ncbi:DUF4142 domain-containing protein [Nannocystis punicea]|uniref:DUF4142 domain-containing protein n=1 Tax=Nannocystis punicea TaxID=2995304 RepID=A0ABY7H7E8_9BACT|nr:DUF4142 domain-containing protein [Nannocystis poenicansa]WAS94954.1 DUF4142 domain-containing protein [Nannocystis poenicansa]
MSFTKTSLPLTVALALALPGVAAADMPPDPSQPTPPTSGAPTNPNPPTSPTHNTDTNPTNVQAPTDKMTDEEILMVIETISDKTADHNRKVQKTAKNRRVKKFAENRAKNAKAAKKRQTALHVRHKLKPKPSQIDTATRDSMDQTYKDLDTAAKGNEYDTTYIDDEIQTLTNTLDTIDRKFMPAANLPELRDELNTVRTQVDSDLREAESIRDALRSQPAV